MPKLTSKFDESTTHQAVCTKGDFFGTRFGDPDAAEMEAASHVSKPGKTNHVVKIISTTKTVKSFAKKKNG